jgi:hypothetical protein
VWLAGSDFLKKARSKAAKKMAINENWRIIVSEESGGNESQRKPGG